MPPYLLWFALFSSTVSAFHVPTPIRCVSPTMSAVEVKYAEMSVEALEEELRKSHRRLFEMRLERQQSKSKSFKSHEVRALKAKIAQIM